MKTNKTVLITGVNGFAGSHLAETCVAKGWKVHGTLRSFRSTLKNLKHIGDKVFAVQTHECDVTDYVSIADVVRKIKPDYIFHLAAQSFVPTSWRAPRQTLDTNLIGTLNILEAVQHESPDTIVQVAGSSEEYGFVHPEECPINEYQPLRPLSPYGTSKAAADLLAQQYVASHKLRVVVTRAFNHTGPRRGHAFAESDWAMNIALAEAGKLAPIIQHGNLDAIRDYTDVRDTVRGYILAVERGKPGEVYNLCSGKNQSLAMGQVLQLLADMSTVKVEFVQDPSRMRPSDVPRLIGDASKASEELGWEPEISISYTLADLLDYYRQQLGVPIPERDHALIAGAI